MKHLLKMLDLSVEGITDILNTTDQLKHEEKHSIPHPRLAGKTLGTIFQKASTGTRVLLETSMHQLGGYPLFLPSSDLQTGCGESVQDIIRVPSWHLDGIMTRTYEQSEVETLAEYGSIPVINGLTGFAHPYQVLVDLIMVRGTRGQLDDLKICFTGDGNNMLNSLAVGDPKMGMRVSAACSRGYELDAWVPEFAKGNPNPFLTDKPKETIAGADVVITDVWSSMDTEAGKERCQYDSAGYQINSENLKLVTPGAAVLHCPPAHRGEEVTEEMFEAHIDEIFEEAGNRPHAQKAALIKLLG